MVGYDIKVKFSVSVGVSGYVRVRVRSGAYVGRGQMSYVILGSGGVSAGIKKRETRAYVHESSLS